AKDRAIPSGTDPQNLNDKQRADLDRVSELQRRLADRTGQLLSKMERVGKERAAKDPENAEAFKDAAEQGAKNNVEGAMRQAGDAVRKNQLGKAGAQQKEGTKGMEKVVQALEERREADLDRLIKK